MLRRAHARFPLADPQKHCAPNPDLDAQSFKQENKFTSLMVAGGSITPEGHSKNGILWEFLFNWVANVGKIPRKLVGKLNNLQCHTVHCAAVHCIIHSVWWAMLHCSCARNELVLARSQP